jgi:hypothetical protein
MGYTFSVELQYIMGIHRRSWLNCGRLAVSFSLCSGHGTGADGIALEDDAGNLKLVSSDALGRLFRQFDCIECVLLNACYSAVQHFRLHRSVAYVVGMNQAIGDRAGRVWGE